MNSIGSLEWDKTFDFAVKELFMYALHIARKLHTTPGTFFDDYSEREQVHTVQFLLEAGIRRCTSVTLKLNRADAKRADLYREWNLANLANDENYYLASRYIKFCPSVYGGEDGFDSDDFMAYLVSGDLDSQLDELIGVARFCRRMFCQNGWTVNGRTYHDPNMALAAASIRVPNRITLLPKR